MAGAVPPSVLASRPSQVVLPDDADVYIPAVARLWLGKYGITEREIVRNRLLWSSYWNQLIFPYFYKYGNLAAWQGRGFPLPTTEVGHERKYKKWFSQGNLQKLYHILPAAEHYERIVVVEDIVSAIKVSRCSDVVSGRLTGAMPLFGNDLALERITTLCKLTKKLSLWLDPNMREKAVRLAVKARQYGLSANVIFSERDPKEESDERIKELLE